MKSLVNLTMGSVWPLFMLFFGYGLGGLWVGKGLLPNTRMTWLGVTVLVNAASLLVWYFTRKSP